MSAIKKNVPNVLSLTRIIMIVPFIFFLIYEDVAGMFIMIIAILATDYFDGFLARRWEATSDIGKMLDPLADKICIASTVVVLVILRDFPVSLAVALVLRDLVILAAGINLIRNRFPIPVSNNTGRVTVAVFAACMIIYLFRLNFLKIPAVILTVVMLILSLVSYGRIFYRLTMGKKG